MFLTASQDQTVKAWILEKPNTIPKQLATLISHTDSISNVVSSPEGNFCCSVGWDAQTYIWSCGTSLKEAKTDPTLLKKHKRQKTNTVEEPVKTIGPLGQFTGHQGCISGIVWPIQSTLYTSGWDHTVKQWDFQTGLNFGTFTSSRVIHCLAASSRNPSLVAFGSADGILRFWDSREKHESASLKLYRSHRNWISSVQWALDSDLHLVTGSYDYTIRIWDIRGTVPLGSCPSHQDKVLAVDWASDKSILSGGADCALQLHEVDLSLQTVDFPMGNIITIPTFTRSDSGLRSILTRRDELIEDENWSRLSSSTTTSASCLLGHSSDRVSNTSWSELPLDIIIAISNIIEPQKPTIRLINKHWCEGVDKSITSVSICSRQVHEVDLLVRNAVKIVDQKFPQIQQLKFSNVSSRYWPEALLESHLPFLTSLDLSRTKIRDSTLIVVQNFPHLKKLDVSKTRIGDNGIQHLIQATELEHLELNGTSVADTGVQRLSCLTRLRYLGLYKTQVSNEGIAELTTLSNLEELNLGVTSVDDIGVNDLSTLTTLKRLSLRRNQVTDVGIRVLESLVDLTRLVLNGVLLHDHGMASVVSHSNLESLHLRKTKVGNAGIMAMKSLGNLTELDLSKSRVRMGCGAVLSGLSKLSWLSLSRTCINDQDMKFLLKLTNLKSLDIAATRITDEGASHLTGVISLVHLSVARSRVTNAFMSYLPYLTNLQSLNLRQTQVTNSGLVFLRDIKQSLTHLSLAGLVVTDQGMEHVGRLTNLSTLSLFDTYITSGVVLQLMPLAKLQYLDIRATPISQQAVARLKVSLNIKCLRSEFTR
eukprot:g1548.t1